MRIDGGGGGGAPVTPVMSDMEEIHQLKVQMARQRYLEAQAAARRAAEQQARTNTQTARQNAHAGLTKYNSAAQAHQKTWAKAHQGAYTSEKAALAAWQEDWEESDEGKRAWAELAPLLDTYDRAVANDLRVAAANGGGNVKAAVAQEAGELKAPGSGDSWEDDQLDKMVDKQQAKISVETPEARATAMALDKWQAANDRLAYAQGQQATAQKDGALSVLEYWDHEVSKAQTEADAAASELGATLGTEFDVEAGKVLGVPPGQVKEALKGMTDEQFDQVIKNVKANHPGDPLAGFLIDQVGEARRFDRDITVKMKEVQGAVQDIGNHLDQLTPLERKMWDQGDRATLAFLKLAKVDLSQGGDGKLKITVDGKEIELSEIERKLLRDDDEHDPDLRILGLMLLGGIRINETVVEGKPSAVFTLNGDRMMPVAKPDGSIEWLRFRDAGDGGWIPVEQAPDGSWVPALKKDGQSVPVVKNDKGEWVQATKNEKGEWVPVPNAAPLASVKDLSGYGISNELLQQASSDAKGTTLSNLAYSLMPYMEMTPDLKVLMGATSMVRVQNTKDQVQALLAAGDETGAMRALTTNMDAAFSPAERQRIWTDVGLTELGYDFIKEHIRDLTAKPNSDPMANDPETLQARQDSTTYADKVGRWMQTILDVAPPEFADLLLTVVKDEASKDWQLANNSVPGVDRGLDFYKGISKAVEMAPGRAEEFANWMTDWDGAAYWVLPSLQGQSFLTTVRSTMSGGDGALSLAIADKLAHSEGGSARYSEFQQAVDIGDQEYREHQAKTVNRLLFEDFQANQGRIVNPYFDHILNGKVDVTKLQTIGGHEGEFWLENFIGTAEGKTPTNLAAAEAGDNSQRWFEAQQDVIEIDLIARWIRKESGDDWQIRAIPVIYASERDGYKYGALFQLQGPDGKQVVIDGLAAPDLAAKSGGDPKKVDDDELPYKYDSLRNYQDDNHLSEGGKLYLPYELAEGMDPHGLEHFKGNSDIAVIDAGYKTNWERAKFVGGIALAIIGFAAAPFTGSASAWISGAAWTAIGLGVGSGIWVTVDDLATMSGHGQSIGWSNAQARSAWIGLAGSLVGGKTVLLRIGNQFGALNALNRFSGNLALAGAIGGDTVRMNVGLAGLGFVRNSPRLVMASDVFAVGTGGYLTLEQGSSLLANWDSMTDSEKNEAVWMFGLGIFQLGTGVVGLRKPMELQVGANWKGAKANPAVAPAPHANNPQHPGQFPRPVRIAGTGLQNDVGKKVFVGGQWFDKSTGEAIEVASSGDFRPASDLVPVTRAEGFDTPEVAALPEIVNVSDESGASPTDRPSQYQALGSDLATRINIRGFTREDDLNTYVYVGGKLYSQATGEPVNLRPSDGFTSLPEEIPGYITTGGGQPRATLSGHTPNLRVVELDPAALRNTPLDLDRIRASTTLAAWVKGGADKLKQASIAVAAVEDGGTRKYVLALSGLKIWKGGVPESIKIAGTWYELILPTRKTTVPAWDRWTVMRTDAKASVDSLFGGTSHTIEMSNNYHPDSLVFEYLEKTYAGRTGDIDIAIQNVSRDDPGMCIGCTINVHRFAETNPHLNLNVMEGTAGTARSALEIDPGLDAAGRRALQTALASAIDPSLAGRPVHLVVTNGATFDYAFGIASGQGRPPVGQRTGAIAGLDPSEMTVFVSTDGSPQGVTLVFAKRTATGEVPDVIGLLEGGSVPVVSKTLAITHPPLDGNGPIILNEQYAAGDPAETIPAAQGGTQRPFTVKMSPARQRLLQTKFDVETEAAVRKQFSDQIDPAAPFSKPVIRLGDAEFEALYAAKGGKWPPSQVRAFRDPASDQIYLRDRPASFLDTAARTTLGHEYLHQYAAPEFDGGPADVVHRLTDASIHEGATEYLAFKAFGPKQYAGKPFGYLQYIKSVIDRTNAVPDDLPYWREALIAENVFERMGPAASDAYFRGDRSAINDFQLEALLDEDVSLVFRGPGFVRSAPQAAAAGRQPRAASQPPGDAYAASSWGTFYRRLQKGQVTYPTDQYVYVVRSPRGADALFSAGDIAYQGKIRAGATDIDWIGAPPPNVSARKVADIFGSPGQGKLFRVVVSSIDPQAMQQTQGRMRVPLTPQLPGQPVKAATPTVTALSGDGYPAYSWTTFRSRLQNGRLTYPADHYVYVVRAGKTGKGGDLSFRASDIAFQGKIDAGAHDVNWIGAAPNIAGKTVADIFGSAGAGKLFRIVVSPETPATLAQNQGVLKVSFTTNPPGAPVTVKTPVPPPVPAPAPLPPVPQGVPLSGAASKIFPTRLWPETEAAIRRGFFASPDDQYVYVYAVPQKATGLPADLSAGDLQAYGILPAGADEIMWQPGFNATPEQIAKGGTVLEAWGTPTQPYRPGVPRGSEILAFVISKTPKKDLDSAGSMTDIPWVLEKSKIPGPANAAAYQQPRYGFKGGFKDHDRGPRAYAGVQTVIGVNDAYHRMRGQVYRPGEGWGPSGEPNDVRRVPQFAVTFLRGPKYAYQDKARGTVVAEAHNHKGTFVHPFYIHDRAAVQRLLRAGNTPGIINDPDVEIQISNQFVPYAVMRGGKWTGYTDRDTARTTVKYAPMDDWKTLRHWSELTPEEQAHVIPSITGIPTYPGAGIDPVKYLSDLLTWNYDVYPMAGELTVRAKELWTILTGRTHTTTKPLLSTDVGEMVGRDEQTLLSVFEALRDAGILTNIHNDASFAEFGVDGRPTPASGDARFFFGLMRLLMMVGPYDMSGIPFDGPNFSLSDGDVSTVLAAGPSRRGMNVFGSHFFMANITKAAPHHFELLTMLLNHPLLEHVNLDASWLPTAEHMLSDVNGFADIISTGRVFYGGDILNFQSIQQLAAPWFMQQPILGRLDAIGTNAMGHDALNWYAGDAFREAYAKSKPAIDWFRYRNYRAGTSQALIDDMPRARRAGYDKWIADYEAAHPEVLDPAIYQSLLAKDQIPGQQPVSALWTPKSTSLPRIQLRSTDLQDAVFKLAHGEEVDLNEITGRNKNPMLAEPPASASKGTPVTLPSRADIEAFLLGDAIADVRSITRPDGSPYSEAAYDAGDNARKTGANRALQLLTMAMTDLVDRSQEPVNAKLEVEGNHSDRSIRNRFIGTFAAMVATASGFSAAATATPELRTFLENNPAVTGSLPWIVAGALFVRGTVNVFGNASRQTNRKLSEAQNEQGIARPKWIEFLKGRILKYGPQSGHDPRRFEGDQGIREVLDNAIAGVAYLMDSPLDIDAGETQALRHQFITTIESLLQGQVGSILGAAQGGLESTNFRTPSGKWISAGTAIAYEFGVLGSIADLAVHPDHFYAYASGLGAFLYATHHALGAISGHYQANWTELPFFNRTMSIGANAVVSSGAGLYAAEAASEGHYGQAAFAGIASLAMIMAARLGLRAEFPRTPAELRRHPSDSIGKLRDLLERAVLPGDTGQPGVSKPRRLPMWLTAAGVSLIGLALTMALDELEKDKKKQIQPGQTPTPSPTPILTPSPSPTPTPSVVATLSPSVSPSPSLSPSVIPTYVPRPRGKQPLP
ncbi:MULTISPECIES: hypothetical protein [Rhodomicrobium]|uniref:hypothetical protein n=1 Tax=Rhodomicrobium TaxID=1068 RepID=UPI000B4AF720|nr:MULTISPECIES: hypothetical protein [Rhodomicrobium]